MVSPPVGFYARFSTRAAVDRSFKGRAFLFLDVPRLGQASNTVTMLHVLLNIERAESLNMSNFAEWCKE